MTFAKPWTAAGLLASLALTLSAAVAGPAELGQRLSDFELEDAAGRTHRLSEHEDEVVVLVAWGSACPTSEDYAKRLRDLARSYRGDDVVFLGLAPNGYETAAKVSAAKREQDLPFPVLLDGDGEVAGRLGAGVTPTAYVVAPRRILAYEGGIDDDPSGRRSRRERYLKEAIDAALAGRDPDPARTRARGSRIR